MKASDIDLAAHRPLLALPEYTTQVNRGEDKQK